MNAIQKYKTILASDKEVAPAVLLNTPTPGPKGGTPMATHRILRGAVRDEPRRTILREATQHFNHELMDDEERMLLLDRIKRLRRGLS